MTDDASLDEQTGTMDDTDLVSLLQDEELQAVSFRDSDLAAEQELAIDYYEAKPFGDEEDGRSQVVVPDVAETVDYMAISILRTCVSGDRVVEFEAKEEEDLEAADEATEAVSYTFMRAQDGYKVLTDWVQSGLIEKYGVVKTSVVEERRKRRVRYKAESDDDIAAIMDRLAETGAVPVAQTEVEGGLIIDAESRETYKCYRDFPIPSEEFLFSSQCRDVDDMGYKCHRTRKTVSELVEMGFDRDLVESLPESGPNTTDSRTTARWDDEILRGDTKLPGMRKVWLCEEYVNVDRNDDGIAELLQVFRVGTVILAIEEVEENPFAVFTPFPRAHRMVGNSLADKVMDIQRVRSVIMRQTLDGMYLTNNPRMWLPQECQNENTIDDLLTVRPGGIVRGKGETRPEPLYEPFDVSRGMAILELMTGERESRTGITRLNQGLDADALNKTATGTALMQAQGQQMEEYVARNFAEAMARLFAKKLRLMIEHGDPIAVKVEGGFKTVDPTTWKPDLDVSIRVGLGSGRKDQRVAFRNQLLQYQQIGLQGGLVAPEHIYRNMAALIRDMALGNPSDYWPDPSSPEGQQMLAQMSQNKGPDPKMAAIEQKGQADAAKLLQKSQTDQINAVVKAHSEGAKLQAQQDKNAMDAQLEVRRQDMEMQVAQQELIADLAGHAVQANRPGGSLAK